MKNNAFSLVELSIVLVILGLLTGGILSGQSLIRAAELRAITTEYQAFATAGKTFQSKYFALPGDMTIAQSFWGIAHATAATCVTTTTNDARTCNGDGDGKINPNSSTVAVGSNEQFRFWQHLANAGLIEGSYTGVQNVAANNSSSLIGGNVPRSKVGNAGWSVYFMDKSDAAETANRYTLDYGNTLQFGTNNGNARPNGAVLTTEEAWNIDTKMDDGKPAYGSIIARYWNNLCGKADDNSHAADDYNASYNLTLTGTQCALYFRNAF